MRDLTEFGNPMAVKKSWLASTETTQFRIISIGPFGILRTQIQSRGI